MHQCLDRKLSEGDFERAVRSLLKAGFRKSRSVPISWQAYQGSP